MALDLLYRNLMVVDGFGKTCLDKTNLWVQKTWEEWSFLPKLWIELQRFDRHIKEPHVLPKFSTKLKEISILQKKINPWYLTYIPQDQNTVVNSLTRTAKSFHMKLCCVGCSILIYFFIPYCLSKIMVFRYHKKKQLEYCIKPILLQDYI